MSDCLRRLLKDKRWASQFARVDVVGVKFQPFVNEGFNAEVGDESGARSIKAKLTTA